MAVVPSEGGWTTPVWDATTAFQHSFETGESLTLFTTDGGITTSAAGGAADGSYYAILSSTAYLRKYLNNSASVNIRFAYRLGAGTANRQIFRVDYGGSPTTLGTLTYTHSGTTITDSLTGKAWTAPSDWQVMEYQFNPTALTAYVWCDSTYIGSAAIASIPDQYLRMAFGDGGTQAKILHIDAIQVGVYRSGLPGAINAHASDHTRAGDIELDGKAYNLFAEQLQEHDISGFAPRLGAGDPSYSDLSGFQHFLIPSGHHGLGQTEMLGTAQGDENAYLTGLGIDTVDAGIFRLANQMATPVTTALAEYANMVGGEIVSCSVEGDTIFGLKYGVAAASASHVCLYRFNRSNGTITAAAGFTCTHGVQDLLYDGTSLYITLGGTATRMKAYLPAADFTNALSFTDVGQTSVVDMGKMAVYYGGVWVSERTKPIIHMAAAAGLTDLDKTTNADETRVGPGAVPINSMCAYNGVLYVGREDGLYAVTTDLNMAFVTVVETVERNTWNYRSMVVHGDYLIYAIGRHIYRYAGGQSKQEITPGFAQQITSLGISNTFPYQNIDHWESFKVTNNYLYAVGYDSTGAGHVFVFNGSGWCRLYALSNLYSTTEFPAGLAVTPDSADEPLIHYCTAKQSGASAGLLSMARASARMGAEAPDTAAEYETSGTWTTSYMAFGLPLVPKLFRMVRIEVEGATVTCPIKVEYYVWTGQEEKTGTLGVLTQPDSNFLMFPAGTLGTRLKLKLTFTRASAATPVIRRVVVQYLDRPDPVWGYDLTLDLHKSVMTTGAEPNPHTYEEMKQHLRRARSSESYLRFVDPDGNVSEVLVSGGPEFRTVRSVPTAHLTLMVIKRFIWTPGTRGISAA